MGKMKKKQSFFKNYWKTGFYGLVLFGFIFFLQDTVIPYLNSSGLKDFLIEYPSYGAFLVIVYTAISHVIAPLLGAPVTLLSTAVFGIVKTTLYIYIGSIISTVLCFYIARIFGRKTVIKLIGSKKVDEIDQFIDHAGTKTLVISRLIGFSFFEIVSYAFGLTLIPFWKYFWISALLSIIPSAAIAFIFKDSQFSHSLDFTLFLGFLGVIQLIYLSILRYQWKNKK
jgi:uncharacterized membrane protein YdjX (TVP38/TMEM64 family)